MQKRRRRSKRKCYREGVTHIGLVHGASHVLVRVGVDLLEELVEGGVPFELLVLLLLLDVGLQLVPVNRLRPLSGRWEHTRGHCRRFCVEVTQNRISGRKAEVVRRII